MLPPPNNDAKGSSPCYLNFFPKNRFAPSSRMVPIIFIHRGWSPYLYHVLKQARLSNPDAPIYLLGDASNKIFSKLITHEHYLDYFTEAAQFQTYYQHRDTCAYNYTLFAFQRHFILKEFLMARDLTRCFHADSDLMIYCDITAESEKFKHFDCTMTWEPEHFVASPHGSFWNNVETLKTFCAFVMNMYQQKDSENFQRMLGHYENLQRQKQEGGIIDMTALWLFRLNQGAAIGDMQTVIAGTTYDHNINTAQNGQFRYELRQGVKKILWENHVPFGIVSATGQKVRFNALHFQGNAKKYIRKTFLKHSGGGWLQKFWEGLYYVDIQQLARFPDRAAALFKKYFKKLASRPMALPDE